MSTSYVYDAVDTNLTNKISSGLGVTPDSVGNYNDAGVIVRMPSPLSTDDKQALDDLMSDQQYQPSSSTLFFRRSFSVTNQNVAVSSLSWVDIGTFVVSPQELFSDTTKIVLKIAGSFITSGTNAKLRIIEDDLNGTQRALMSSNYTFADSSSAQAFYSVNTDQSLSNSSNQFVYRVQCETVLLTSLTVESCTVTALESLT